MVKTTTLVDFQAAQTDSEQQPERDGFNLGDLAQRMVRERPAGDGHVGDPFEGMSLDVDPSDAIGLVEAQIRAWCEERDRWATPVEIRDMADKLLTEAKSARPGPAASATYTVSHDGTVGDYMPIDAERELPGMPGHPEAPAAEPVDTSVRLIDPSVWGTVSEAEVKASLLWTIPQNNEFRRGQFVAFRDDENDVIDYLIRNVRPLQELARLQIVWKWKLKGGRSHEEPRLIRIKKADPDLADERGHDIIIHLSADHLRKMRASYLFMERLLFDALVRIDPAGPKIEPDNEFNKLPGRWRYGWIGPRERLYATLIPHISPALDDTTIDVDATEVVAAGAVYDEDGDASAESPRMWDGQPSDFERQEAAGAAYADEPVCDSAQVDELVNSSAPPDAEPSLVCSVCGNAVDEEELSPEEVSEARQNPAVVLCEACGEDGVIEGDE